jgi:hypothetical protein
MTLLYKRHAGLFEQYAAAVLRAKDRQFAQLHAYAMWQEQQAKNWERVAQERQAELARLGRYAERAARLQRWWRQQMEHAKRTTVDQPGIARKTYALAGEVLRVLRRKVRTKLNLLMARGRRGIL